MKLVDGIIIYETFWSNWMQFDGSSNYDVFCDIIDILPTPQT